MPERIAAVVYVDTAPGAGRLDPELRRASSCRCPPSSGLAADENLDGLSEEQLQAFARQAVPEPGGVVREAVVLTNDARNDIPSTIICTGFPSDQVKTYAKEQNPSWLGGLAELRDVTWIDLPTSHWPMWSRPAELAAIIGDVARAHPRPQG